MNKNIGKRKNPVFYLILMLFLLLFVSSQDFSQSRSRGRRSSKLDDPNLPEQRTPMAGSELSLGDIPYKIVYESFLEGPSGGNWEICMIDADGSNFTNLTNTPDINEFYPHASPDGTRICFVADEGDTRENKRRNVNLMDIDGGGRITIAENAYQPCWSGDGKQIAYLKGEYERYSSSSWSNRGIEFYNLKTKETRKHPNPDLGLLFNLCWSPDGKWFTATSRARNRRGSNIAFRADDATEMALSIRGCRPDISPEGGRLVWGRSDHVLTIGNLDFSSSRNNVKNQKPVIACQSDFKIYHVDWSPDGKYLTFSYGPDRGNQAVGRKASGWNICIYEFETGKWAQVTLDGSHNKEPDWVAVMKD